MTDKQFVKSFYPNVKLCKATKFYRMNFPKDLNIYCIYHYDYTIFFDLPWEKTSKLTWKHAREKVENKLIKKLSY